MKFIRKLFSKPNFIPLLIVIVAGVLAGRAFLTPGYFVMHDDLQMMRQLEMEKCFLDFQIPCRWVPDMGYGFGFPLFNFYPPLPYLVGQVFRLVSFSFVDTVKLVFLLSFIASGVTMYFLAKEFFGKVGGVVSGVFYIWAPYHAIDTYVRGAMNESWALVWFPAILWAGYKLIKEEKNITKWVISLALFWVGLFLSHNLMVLIFGPVFALWCLLFFWKEKAWGKIPKFIHAGLLALALAAFFTLPAALEQKYVQVNTLVTGYYEYIAHFASTSQLLFSRFWGYGPSVWETIDDGMPFQVGHLHWGLSLLIVSYALYWHIKRKKLSPILLAILLMFVVGWVSLFMAHSRSTFIWKMLPPLKFVQFPWRFLTLSTLSFSFLSGAIAVFISDKLAKVAAILLGLSLIAFNWNYFIPKGGQMGPLTDQEKFSGVAWEMQQTAGIYDYLPVDAITAPKEPMKNLGEIMEGKGTITNPILKTNKASFDIKVESEKATVRIGIFKFPKWKVFVDGKEVNTYLGKDEQWGRMYVEVPKGEHKITLKLFNTPIRTISNFISLVAWFFLIKFLAKQHKKNKKVGKKK